MSDTDRLTIRRPDDWHVHFRDGAMLDAVVPFTARQFGRAIVMPNLVPPVTTVAAAAEYRERIMAAVPDGVDFTPLMTAYLTDDTDPDELARGHADGVFTAVKLYPAGATTNSASGVTDLKHARPALARMQEIGMPLLVHGEVTDANVDVFDREAVFIDKVMTGLLADFPALKVVFEHVTTKDAVDFVAAHDGPIAATITAHHLVINRTDIFRGGIRPHLYCLPIAKREVHRQALRAAAASGGPKFFLGTDTAPHAVAAKETACGCAGIFSAPTALEAYVQVFDEMEALANFEAFASLNGPAFYGLPANEAQVTLERAPSEVPATVESADGETVQPFQAGETLPWRLA
ncbi:MAG: dihydroorotase [Magnetovibrio sp.]|nr:dihydroorotase [Magnetovibrio sp.]